MIKKYLYLLLIILSVSGCGVRLKQPFATENARIGENTTPRNTILTGVEPVEPIVVGVYKFRDQTGQYKEVENGTSWSNAVTQGSTTILLKSLEDSKWFVPIERENISNLLNERQIIRSTRKQYDAQGRNIKDSEILPPLLFAGVLLEGGIISYDSNIRTGGIGARYFGVGASSKYREDRITIYLRAVSTSNGKILKTVYTSKTILSQAISASMFRYVDVKKLLEVEMGVTQNEPKQLAVKEAIDKAVQNLIIEGIVDGLWVPKGGQPVVEKVKKKYDQEVAEAKKTKLYNRKFEDRRGANSINISAGGAQMDGDYSNVPLTYNAKIGYKHLFNNPSFGMNIDAGIMGMDNTNPQIQDFMLSLDANLEYIMLPYENISPYMYGGLGSLLNKDFNKFYMKSQVGLGMEYLPTNLIGIRLYGEYNFTFTDELDGLVRGKRNDYFWKFGLGISFYFD